MYDAKKIYYGIVKTYSSEKESGYLINPELGAVGFHLKQFNPSRKNIEIREVIEFHLIGSKNYPGRVRATNIKVIELYQHREIIKFQKINSDEKFTALCQILDKEKSKENYTKCASLAYELSTPLYKLRLWIKKYVTDFDFGLFKLYYFRLNRQEALEFKKYVKSNIRESKREDLRNLRKSNIVENNGEKTTFETSWRDIGFEDGRIYINTGNQESILIAYPWEFAKGDFNLIVTGYITKRELGSIITEVLNNDIVSISGLEDLKEAILIAEITKAKKKVDELLEEGIKPNQIRFHPDFIKLGNADLLRLFGNHECIDYLQKIQSTSLDMSLIYILETNLLVAGSIAKESSYLFSVVLPNDMVSIIWESIKLDRATQIFNCSIKDYFKTITEVEKFLTSDIVKKRSKLRSTFSEDVLLQKDLSYITSVQHTQYDFEKWKRKLHEAIPGLPEPLV